MDWNGFLTQRSQEVEKRARRMAAPSSVYDKFFTGCLSKRVVLAPVAEVASFGTIAKIGDIFAEGGG